MPTDKLTTFEKARANKRPLVEFRAKTEVSKWLEEVKGEGTKRTYSSALFRYWNEFLIKKYPSLEDWIQSVRTQRESKEPMVRKQWVSEVRHFMQTARIGNDRPMSTPTKELLASSVKSFLRAWVDEELDHDFKVSYTTEELQKKQEEEAITVEEMRKLYEACKTARDKALILIAVNGVAPAEMAELTQNWNAWFPKNPNDLRAPFRARLIRIKKKIPYHTTLFEDACEALRTLFEERLQKTGASSKDDLKALFVSEAEAPFTQKTYVSLWETLRERSGLGKKRQHRKPSERAEDFGEREHIHPHGVRHFFKTTSKNYPVDQAVVEYALGHSGDKYGYDKSSSKDEKWCQRVETELAKMKEVLNLKTGIAQEYYESREEELKAKIARDTYKMLIETGALKPDTLTTGVLNVIAKKLGIKFETLVLGGTMVAFPGTSYEFKAGEYEAYRKLPPEERKRKNLALQLQLREKSEVETRLRLFNLVSTAVGLDTEVYHKYMEALKVMKSTTAKLAWENDDWYWMRVEVGSDEYMQALADHYQVVDRDGDKTRILRKPKQIQPGPTLEDNSSKGDVQV